ncbi:flagellar hook-basal body complex protein FliE [Salicola sp. Rm-C-2C1-2]|uniref:flagellar hook-basal body complex protein FliE n=1 Tax=Salicola sp. Rm-C-2C1-2 TaxID=3141321 RepID=UPI0032E530ED
MVERADVNSVLTDIRALREQMQERQQVQPDQLRPEQMQPGQKPGEVQEGEGPSFMDTLQGAVNQVNELQQTSSDLKTRYTQGDPEVDITRVMVESEKASVAFEATTQVRNRVVKAYEKIMNMPI